MNGLRFLGLNEYPYTPVSSNCQTLSICTSAGYAALNQMAELRITARHWSFSIQKLEYICSITRMSICTFAHLYSMQLCVKYRLDQIQRTRLRRLRSWEVMCVDQLKPAKLHVQLSLLCLHMAVLSNIEVIARNKRTRNYFAPYMFP